MKKYINISLRYAEQKTVNATAIKENAELKIAKHSHDLRNAELNIVKLRQIRII